MPLSEKRKRFSTWQKVLTKLRDRQTEQNRTEQNVKGDGIFRWKIQNKSFPYNNSNALQPKKVSLSFPERRLNRGRISNKNFNFAQEKERIQTTTTKKTHEKVKRSEVNRRFRNCRTKT